MAENTTPTEKTNEKKVNTNTGPTFGEHMQQGWDKMHATLGTGGVVAVILAIMLLTVIKGYDDRIDHLKGKLYGQRHHPMMYRDDRSSDERGWKEDMERAHDTMDRRMEMMEERRNTMIREPMDIIPAQPAARVIVPAETLPMPVGQYAGYRSVDGESYKYSLQITEDTLTGTLASDDEDMLKSYAEQLTKLHLDVTGKEGQIQFTGKSTRLGDVARLLNAE